MTTITNIETLNALRDLGCLVDNVINTSALTDILVARLEADHVAGSVADIPAAETTVGQLAATIIGVNDPDFVELVRPLLSATAAGRIQKALANGYVLCGGRSRVAVEIEGETRHVSVATRFLSGDHDVLGRYVLEPRLKRAEAMARSSLAMRELVEARQPDMAEQLELFVDQLNVRWQRALGTGGEE